MTELSPTTKIIRGILLSQYATLSHEDLSNDEPLADQLGLDSLGLIQLCIALEKKFNIQLDGDNLAPDYYHSIRSITALIERLQFA